MKKYAIILVVLILFFNNSLACTNDFQCGYGNKCVKPSDSIQMNGICVTPTDQFGNRTYDTQPQEIEPHEVKGCQFNTDCDIGFSCVKRSGEIYGDCLK
jgi:hypothetical protein